MQISFRIDGGFAVFPGRRPWSIDVDCLPDADACRWRSVVATSRFFDRIEPTAATATGAADTRCYVVTVDDGGRQRTLTIPEDVEDAGLKALVCDLDRQRRVRVP